MQPDTDTLNYDASELCSRIAILTKSIMDFWQNGGWAPLEPRKMLNTSMLKWQSSLALSLSRWVDATTDGDLILAWVNLGALVEGQLKLFLCVYYYDYSNDLDGIIKYKKRIDPNYSDLQGLREFFVNKIWDVSRNWNPYVELIQKRRNAIHAFEFREIGTFEEWKDSLRIHLSFVRDLGGNLPYPDDEQFLGLREIDHINKRFS